MKPRRQGHGDRRIHSDPKGKLVEMMLAALVTARMRAEATRPQSSTPTNGGPIVDVEVVEVPPADDDADGILEN